MSILDRHGSEWGRVRLRLQTREDHKRRKAGVVGGQVGSSTGVTGQWEGAHREMGEGEGEVVV